MHWKTYYQHHLMTAAEAVGQIKSGDRVVIGHACGEPSYLVDAMVANAGAYREVEIVHMVSMGKTEYCKPQYAGHFRHNALFLGGASRQAVAGGYGDFTPAFFSEVPKLFHTTLPVDVALVMVTPPDRDGMCSLGISVDYAYEAVRQARTVIAQINPQMPWTGPHSLVSVKDLDCIVVHDAPLLEHRPGKIGAVEQAIGAHCARLIPNGATLQLGIGAIPDVILYSLRDKRDLGIHSELFSDSVVELAEAGVITNAKKTLHPGTFIATFVMGTRRLYDFVDHNPNVALYPVDYVNSPAVIAQNDNLISINSCVQVDLMGQVDAESIGPLQISGTGGQVDFVRGAAASRGGVSIMAMPSTVKGRISKIVPLLDEGAVVTTSRNDVDYVVTEYGVAPLKGRTLRQRARSLIQIAHPDFRDGLKDAYERRFHCTY